MTYTLDAADMIRTTDGKPLADHVDSFRAQMQSHSKGDVLILRLYAHTEHEGGRETAGSTEVAPENAHQFAMSPQAARRLIGILESFLRSAEGSGQPRQ